MYKTEKLIDTLFNIREDLEIIIFIIFNKSLIRA